MCIRDSYDTPAERELRTRLVSAGPLVSTRIEGTDDVPPDAEFRLRITPTGAGVSGGCNDHRGPLDVDGDVLRFFDGVSQTLVGCGPETEHLDDWITDLLRDGAHAQRTSDGGVILRRRETTVRFVRERPLLRKAAAERRRALKAMEPQPWALTGTARDGKRLRFMPLVQPGRCEFTTATIRESSRRVTIKVGVLPRPCASRKDDKLSQDKYRSRPLSLGLETPLRGRLVTGPKLQQATLFNLKERRRRSERFIVPDVTGLRVGQARTVARNANTTLTIHGRRPRSAADHVYDQRPYPGLFPSPHRRTHSSVIDIKRPLPIQVKVRP